MGQVGLTIKEGLKRCHVNCLMGDSVFDIDSMKKCLAPDFIVQASTSEHGMYHIAKSAVRSFNNSI